MQPLDRILRKHSTILLTWCILSPSNLNRNADISIRELRTFCCLSLSLAWPFTVIWNPANRLDTWYNVKLLSCQLEKFTEYYIIDTKMLDSLLWTLLNRYSYFISLVAKELKQELF